MPRNPTVVLKGCKIVPRLFPLGLEQSVHNAHRKPDVLQHVAGDRAEFPRDDLFFDFGGRLQNVEHQEVVQYVHILVEGLQRVGDGHLLGVIFVFVFVFVLLGGFGLRLPR